MAEVNVSECLLDLLAECYCTEGEPKTNVHNMLLEHGETWQDFMVVITALYQNFERFGNVQDIADFIEVHGREGVNTLYAALGEITALKQRFKDLEDQRADIDAQMMQVSNDIKQARIRFGVHSPGVLRPKAHAAANWIKSRGLPTKKSQHRQAMIDRQES